MALPATEQDPKAIDPNLVLPDDLGDEDDGDGGGEPSGLPDPDQAARVEAASHGWVDKAEWVARGKPAQTWRPAAEFMDVRNNVARITREENSRLRGELAELQRKFAEREGREQQAEGKLTVETLRMQIRSARDAGDQDRADELQDQLVQKQVEATIAARDAATRSRAAPEIAPEVREAFVQFAQTNQWIQKDSRMAQHFGIALKEVWASGVTKDISQAMQLAKDKVVVLFPEQFRRTPPGNTSFADVGGMGGEPSLSGRRSWANLKPAVKRMAENDIAAGLYTQKDFLGNCGAEHFQ